MYKCVRVHTHAYTHTCTHTCCMTHMLFCSCFFHLAVLETFLLEQYSRLLCACSCVCRSPLGFCGFQARSLHSPAVGCLCLYEAVRLQVSSWKCSSTCAFLFGQVLPSALGKGHIYLCFPLLNTRCNQTF